MLLQIIFIKLLEIYFALVQEVVGNNLEVHVLFLEVSN